MAEMFSLYSPVSLHLSTIKRFNVNELLCSVIGVGHARDKLTTIAEGPIIRGHGPLLRI